MGRKELIKRLAILMSDITSRYTPEGSEALAEEIVTFIQQTNPIMDSARWSAIAAGRIEDES